MPGMTEVRPANVVPPVLALVWGPPAVFGIAIGNLVSDILSGSSAFVCTCGFIANFFYAYIPYKLWYSSKVDEKNVIPTLGSVGKIIKYIYIILVDSVVVTGMLSLVFETAGFGASGDSYALLFFNNFDFSVLLGVPVLILIEKMHPDYYIPQAVRKKKGSYLLFDLFLFASAAVGFGWFLLSYFSGSQRNGSVTRVLLVIAILLVLPLIFKPFNFCNTMQHAKNSLVKFTLKAKFTIGFLLIAVICIVFIGSAALGSQADQDILQKWSLIFKYLGLAINVIFAVAIGYLWYVEKNIVGPIEKLSEAAKKFAERPTNTDEIIAPELISIKTGDEISILAQSFNSMMTDITDYMVDLKTVTAEKERIGAELDIATHIQASMLPCIFPAFPDREEFDVFASMTPAKEVGGDFYDFFMVDDTHLAIVMADVSGKGVPAALFMVIGKTLLKDHTQPGRDLGEVFSEVNELLCASNSEGLFITAFEGVLDLATGEFNFVNAGHEMPFICSREGAFKPYKIKPGFVLAGMEEMKYKAGSLALNPGDKVFLYTDGVTEAANAQNELYGMKRLEGALNQNRNAAPDDLLPSIKADIDQFVGEAPQFDDITMLCMEYKSKAEM